MIINGTTLSNLNVAFNASFKKGFDAPQSYWPLIATLVSSTTKTNEYGWLGSFPGFREWIGDRVINKLAAHGYSITNKPFELTVGVERDDIDDDNLGIYTPMMEELGRAASVHPDELIFKALLEGFTQACFDGQYFFDTDHPVIVDGETTSASNMTAGAENPWFLMDTKRSLKPIIYQKRKDYEFQSLANPDDPNVFLSKKFLYGADGRGNVGYGFWQMAHGSKATLNTANFRAARNAMRSLKNDEGTPLGISPNILVVGTSNSDKARDALMTERLPNGATNPDYKLVEIVEVPWLD